MKWYVCVSERKRKMSLPVRGAWVEMLRQRDGNGSDLSLPVRGAWVEIAAGTGKGNTKLSRSPCGERGLKSDFSARLTAKHTSLPVRGAWVEICIRKKSRQQ